jgi:hypothetical protein
MQHYCPQMFASSSYLYLPTHTKMFKFNSNGYIFIIDRLKGRVVVKSVDLEGSGCGLFRGIVSHEGTIEDDEKSVTAYRPTLRFSQPHIQCVPGTLTPRVKRPGRETGHSLPSSAEFNNAWSYTSTSTLPVRLHGVALSKAPGKYVTFTGFLFFSGYSGSSSSSSAVRPGDLLESHNQT